MPVLQRRLQRQTRINITLTRMQAKSIFLNLTYEILNSLFLSELKNGRLLWMKEIEGVARLTNPRQLQNGQLNLSLVLKS